MANPSKSQWNFGELFPTEATRRVLSVTELTGQVKRLLEQQIGLVWVTGEITNLRVQSSGHIYFTLKDAASQVTCVLFRGTTTPSRALLADGRKVVVQGDVTVYEPRGQYQLVVRAVELQGVGALQLAFEKLKAKLAAEGWFAPERKRPLPRYPQRIGLVTSPTGAAIRDVLHVIQRRQPGLEIVFVPCRVQGAGAAEEIAAAVRLLNEWAAGNTAHARENLEPDAASPLPLFNPATPSPPALDLILITRGGGSLEDLWAFNEEVVARAIFESAIPVVSAVGHEIDFTISDFVADLRAATPSAAAEIITEGAFASRQLLAHARARMAQLAGHRLERAQTAAAAATHRLARVHPQRRVEEHWQRVDDLREALARATRSGFRRTQTRWETVAQRLGRLRPEALIERRRQVLRELRRRLAEQAHRRIEAWQARQTQSAARLKLLSPLNVLERGYSITLDAASGAVLRSAAGLAEGRRLKTRLKDGTVSSVVAGGTH